MKKIAIAALIAGFALNAGAQNMYDALRYSSNTYYGTARSMAMGNAFTALGGDAGSIGINPAGSAVNSYSQATFTPNLSIITNTSSYNANPSTASSIGYGMQGSRARLTAPNFGVLLNMPFREKRGLKTITLGIMANSTNIYLDDMTAEGSNSQTSYLGELAKYATDMKLDPLVLDKADYANTVSPYTWDVMTAYRSRMLATYGAESDRNYVGATQTTAAGTPIAGELSQKYGRRTHGNKLDIVYNLGFNFSDILYLGFNVGTVSISYNNYTYFKEAVANSDDIPNFANDFDGNTVHFTNMRMRQNLEVEGNGAYAKLGFILRPAKGLRLGAAIQTPTNNNITEHYQVAADGQFDNVSYNGKAESTIGTYEYKVVSPYRVTTGIAYTIGGYGLISADYEYSDYSTMRIREENWSTDAFKLVNNLNRFFFGGQHMLRIGCEIKPVPEVSLRAGYNLTTSPECHWYDNYGKVLPGDYEAMWNDTSLSDSDFNNWEGSLYGRSYTQAFTHSVAVGVGYSSKGSFFWDLAFRGTVRPDEYIYPYGNYIPDVASPEITMSSRLWDMVMTFGWRF